MLKIRILSILLALVLVAFTFYVIASEGYLDNPTPYPSEDTPLTLESWGLTWDREFEESINDDPPGLEYCNMSISFTEYDLSAGSTGRTNSIMVVEFIDADTFVAPTTEEEAEELCPLSWTTYWDGESEIRVIDCYFISDNTDTLRFNTGDSISLVHLEFKDGVLTTVGFQEGLVYEIEFIYEGVMTIQGGYGFAVQDGELYSWLDHGPVDDPLS
ncbi:MAG TPA: hypothetical protein HA364_03305 [Thermoplasmata archaeon]|nr:hypothetical protein [Thermoplasmata archaeon]